MLSGPSRLKWFPSEKNNSLQYSFKSVKCFCAPLNRSLELISVSNGAKTALEHKKFIVTAKNLLKVYRETPILRILLSVYAVDFTFFAILVKIISYAGENFGFRPEFL